MDRNVGWPNGLAIDYEMKRIYWNDAKGHTIDSSDLEGRHVVTLIQEVPHPFGLTLVSWGWAYMAVCLYLGVCVGFTLLSVSGGVVIIHVYTFTLINTVLIISDYYVCVFDGTKLLSCYKFERDVRLYIEFIRNIRK